MDGVLVREEHALPGAAEFLQRLVEKKRPFLVLTNNSIFTPRDLSARLSRSGLSVPESAIWTSALATAAFLSDQLPGGSAYVIGEAGMTTALHEVGYTLTESSRTSSCSAKPAPTRSPRSRRRSGSSAGRPVHRDQPRRDRPVGRGPAAGYRCDLGHDHQGHRREPYVVGKPNPMMFRTALNRIGAHSENTGMIGDRMDTDIVAGIEAGLQTVLVLTGVAHPRRPRAYPFRPSRVLPIHRRSHRTRVIDALLDLCSGGDHRR